MAHLFGKTLKQTVEWITYLETEGVMLFFLMNKRETYKQTSLLCRYFPMCRVSKIYVFIGDTLV